jgi:ABC-type sugar transport system ATPase subunit
VEIYNIITKLARQGVAIIMVSSELPELLGMCDRLIVIGRGKIRGNIPRSAFTQDRVMKAATCIEEYGVENSSL